MAWKRMGMRMLMWMTMMRKKMQTLFSLLFAFCVRWVEDVCVRKVGSRERVVIGDRTCGRGRCTRVWVFGVSSLFWEREGRFRVWGRKRENAEEELQTSSASQRVSRVS